MNFHDSMEVASKDAFGTFLDNLVDCYETLPWKDGVHAHWKDYGEDKFMHFCMDKHGITRVPSRCPRMRTSMAFTSLSAALDTARNLMGQ